MMGRVRESVWWNLFARAAVSDFNCQGIFSMRGLLHMEFDLSFHPRVSLEVESGSESSVTVSHKLGSNPGT